jgi:flagellar motor switch/type III secretory pathway protein FliN
MLTPEIASDIVAQCQVACGEIGQALSRAFGSPFEVAIAEPTTLRDLDPPEQLESAGVVIALHFGLAAMAIFLPQSRSLLPRGYDSADPKAQSKLTTLAQELGMLVLPEALLAEDAQGFCVANLADALREGAADEDASVVTLSLRSDGKQGEALIIWPLSSARQITRAQTGGVAPAAAQHVQSPVSGGVVGPPGLTDAAAEGETLGDAASAVDQAGSDPCASDAWGALPGSERTNDPPSSAASRRLQKGATRGPGLRDLPTYSRSLLKIRVPLSVTLAEKKQPLGQILEIGPGSILQFEKSCEDMLDLNVSNLAIARGEAVKVGDKFGLRVTSLILPSERFKTVQPAWPGDGPRSPQPGATVSGG